MELRHLATFRAVAKNLSFTQAAAELGYVQSALTAHVKALEAELGVRLFDRQGRRIVLTDSGVSLLGYAENMLELAREATIAVGQSGEPKGPVTICAPEVLCTYRLPAVIRQLHQQHPGVQLLFRNTTTGALDAELKRALASGEIDVALVLEEAIDATTSLTVQHLTDEPLAIIAAPDHPLARAAAVGAADLADTPVLLTDKGCGYRRVFERALQQAGIQPTIAGEFISGDTVKRCVQAGTAIGVLAAVSVQDELTDGRLAALAWTGPPLRLRSYLVIDSNRWISPAAAALREATSQALACEPPPTLLPTGLTSEPRTNSSPAASPLRGAPTSKPELRQTSADHQTVDAPARSSHKAEIAVPAPKSRPSSSYLVDRPQARSKNDGLRQWSNRDLAAGTQLPSHRPRVSASGWRDPAARLPEEGRSELPGTGCVYTWPGAGPPTCR